MKTKLFLIMLLPLLLGKGLGEGAFAQAVTQSATVTVNTKFTIPSVANATPGATYRWLENGIPIASSNTATYVMPGKAYAGRFEYVRQAQAAGCTEWINSNTFILNVRATLPTPLYAMDGTVTRYGHVLVSSALSYTPVSNFCEPCPSSYPPTPCYRGSYMNTACVAKLNPCELPWRLPTKADCEQSGNISWSFYKGIDQTGHNATGHCPAVGWTYPWGNDGASLWQYRCIINLDEPQNVGLLDRYELP
jgi:hypothetical protein